MKNKGYTLVELIAMIVVIGVLMVITVPNIAGILKKNKETIVVEDVHRMVANTKRKLETEKAKHPGVNECTVMSLGFINNNDDFTEGANGGKYDMDNSLIVVKKVKLSGESFTSNYKFYIRLIEKKGNNYYQLNFIDYDDFVKNPTGFSLTDYGSPTDIASLMEGVIQSGKYDNVCLAINEAYGSELCSKVAWAYNSHV